MEEAEAGEFPATNQAPKYNPNYLDFICYHPIRLLTTLATLLSYHLCPPPLDDTMPYALLLLTSLSKGLLSNLISSALVPLLPPQSIEK